jgi:hypothetical protein
MMQCARYLLGLAIRDGKPMDFTCTEDVIRLNHLLYYAQGHHLATYQKPLFHDSIFADVDGPMCLSQEECLQLVPILDLNSSDFASFRTKKSDFETYIQIHFSDSEYREWNDCVGLNCHCSLPNIHAEALLYKACYQLATSDAEKEQIQHLMFELNTPDHPMQQHLMQKQTPAETCVNQQTSDV